MHRLRAHGLQLAALGQLSWRYAVTFRPPYRPLYRGRYAHSDYHYAYEYVYASDQWTGAAQSCGKNSSVDYEF